MQFAAVRVPAQPESQPFGARVLVSQVFESIAYDGIVLFAERVEDATMRLRTESGTVYERERVGQRCSVTSDTEIVVLKSQEVSWYAATRMVEWLWLCSSSVVPEPKAGLLKRVRRGYRCC